VRVRWVTQVPGASLDHYEDERCRGIPWPTRLRDAQRDRCIDNGADRTQRASV